MKNNKATSDRRIFITDLPKVMDSTKKRKNLQRMVMGYRILDPKRFEELELDFHTHCDRYKEQVVRDIPIDNHEGCGLQIELTKPVGVGELVNLHHRHTTNRLFAAIASIQSSQYILTFPSLNVKQEVLPGDWLWLPVSMTYRFLIESVVSNCEQEGPLEFLILYLQLGDKALSSH